MPYELLDRDGFVKVEPALALTKEKFVGALRLPGDETGDCFKFSNRLAEMAQGLGVSFRWGTQIQALEQQGGADHRRAHRRRRCCGPTATCWRWAAIRRCCCSRSACACRSIRSRATRSPCRSPMPQFAPESTIMDETHKVAVTRLGDRIRVGGTAELAGYSLKLREARRATLEHVVTDLFPKGGDVSKASFWCGLRPMTPDGTPIVGAHAAGQPAADHRPRHAGLDHGRRHRPRDRRPGVAAASPRSTSTA